METSKIDFKKCVVILAKWAQFGGGLNPRFQCNHWVNNMWKQNLPEGFLASKEIKEMKEEFLALTSE